MDLWLPPKPAIVMPAEKKLIAPPALAGVQFINAWLTQGGSAGITFLNSVSGSKTDGTDVTLSLSSLGLALNDIVIVASAQGGNPPPTGGIPSTSGYTQLANIDGGASGGSNNYTYAGYKRMTGSPDANVVVIGTAFSGLAMQCIAFGFRGVNATTAIDATTTTARGSSTNPNPPAITPVTNNAAIVVVGSMLATPNDVTPGTITNYSAPAVSGVAGSFFDNTLAMCYRILVGGAGVSEDPGAFPSWATGDWGAVTIALRPA